MRKFILSIFSLFLLACSSGPKEEVLSGEALGTSYQIRYFSDSAVLEPIVLDSIMEAINRSMSTYREDSDISRLNRGDSLIQVDTMFQRVFLLSQQVYRESEGRFDPTVGDLVNLYGFGPEKGLNRIDTSSVDSLMRYVGLDKITVGKDGRVSKDFPEVYLDFNAIAKGYAIDVIGMVLEEKGVEHFLIELGGELLASGENIAKNKPWTVGIDDPEQTGESRELKAVLELKDRAMATSGNYRKFRVDSATGNKYVHTINPLTGFPEKSNLLSATVLAENCALADAYATAFMALGLEKSKEMLDRLSNVDVYFIFAQEEGELGEFLTDGFQQVLLE